MIKCRVEMDADYGDEYPHKLLGLKEEEAFFLQNFINTLGLSGDVLEMGSFWGNDSHFWISEEEYEALISNANLLGIEFTVSD